MKRGINSILKAIKHEKLVAMLAPSFIAQFSYPNTIVMLKSIGIKQVVELTFGAKMINREYHKALKNSKKLVISSVCPGVVETISKNMPKFRSNLVKIDSPMTAMAKICKKAYPKHKTLFISPCHFKKTEAEKAGNIDYVIDYSELEQLIRLKKIKTPSKSELKGKTFDKFYNDYTKIYPLAGGLSKTAHLRGIIKSNETKVIDGIRNVVRFLEHPDKKIKFLDANFCVGGCIGGPCFTNKLSIAQRKQRVLKYMRLAKKESIPESSLGLIKKAQGINFTR